MKIAIVGAGGIGTVFGASLGNEHDVVVLVRSAKIARAIASRGGLLVDAGAPVRVTATHDASALAVCDLAIVAVKTYATIDALAPLRRVLRDDTIVLSVQNGIDAPAQIEYALGHRRPIAAGPTTEAARSPEPGVATRNARGTTTIGWVAGHDRPTLSLRAMASSLTASGLAACAVDDVMPYLWEKLAINAAINPVTALARVTNGDLLETPELFERGVTIAHEVIALAASEGIALPFDDVRERVRAVCLATAPNRSSMLQDLERGRPTEIDAILGTVLRRAAARGLDVPASRAAYDEVRRATNA